MNKVELKKLHQDLYSFQVFAGGRVGDVSEQTNYLMEKIEEVIRSADEAPLGFNLPPMVIGRRFSDNNPPGALNILSKQIMATVALIVPADLDITVLLYAKGSTKREISCTTTMLPADTVSMLQEFIKKQAGQSGDPIIL